MLDLYTLICEYGGGTYIAQVNASSPKKAILSWLDGLGSRRTRDYESKKGWMMIRSWPSAIVGMCGALALRLKRGLC